MQLLHEEKECTMIQLLEVTSHKHSVLTLYWGKRYMFKIKAFIPFGMFRKGWTDTLVLEL